jgi:hypothetical protein
MRRTLVTVRRAGVAMRARPITTQPPLLAAAAVTPSSTKAGAPAPTPPPPKMPAVRAPSEWSAFVSLR